MLFQTINPLTGKLVKQYDAISDSVLSDLVGRAHAAYSDDWRSRELASRAAILHRAAALFRDRSDELAAILVEEVGKRIGEARAEVAISANILDYYAEHGPTFLRSHRLEQAPAAMVLTEPLGVILAIEPWNFPYYQVARVVGPQLIAGNALLLKHAENVPKCALALERLFVDAGVPDGVYTNVFASVEQTESLIDDPRVRGVTLTGSERAGSSVAERAGRNLKKVVLELGGSDPLIVLEDAPLEWAVKGAVAGRMIATGQCCIGSKRIIVVGKKRGEKFLSDFCSAMATLRAGDPADPETTLGPLATKKGMQQLLSQIAIAVDDGATVMTGGKQLPREGFFIEPTVITNISPSNRIFSQELFGPVAQFFVVDTVSEAISLANAVPYGLGASIFTEDLERAQDIARQIDSGMVFVNQPSRTAPELPFGGVKSSGFGRELSELGINEFVNKKLVHLAPVGAPASGVVAFPQTPRMLV